jgi:hypothetical protein
MKKITLLLSLIIVTTIAFSNGIPKNDQVHVLSARRSILYLKLKHELIGATLEIYNESGELVLSQVVTERKVLIDFDNERDGIYKIKIMKGDEQTVVRYINNDSSFTENEESESITVAQGI